MLSWVMSLIGGGLIERLSAPFLQAYQAKLASQNDANKISGDIAMKQIDAEIAARGDARTIRLATAGFWEMRFITALIAGCFTLHLLLVTLDTCFRLGWKIPAFPHPFSDYQGAILLSFFGVQVVGQGVMAIAMSIRGKR